MLTCRCFFCFTVAEFLWGVRKVHRQTYTKITLPVLIAHGNKDPITCFKTAKQLFDNIPSTDKTFREWDGLYHERKRNLVVSFPPPPHIPLLISIFLTILFVDMQPQFTTNMKK